MTVTPRKCGKRLYRSHEEAMNALFSARRNMGTGRAAVYKCEVCRFPSGAGVWHWGHLPRKQRRRRR